jgi:hypothetical protein
LVVAGFFAFIEPPGRFDGLRKREERQENGRPTRQTYKAIFAFSELSYHT